MARALGQLPRTDRSPGPLSQIALLGTVVVRGAAGVEVVVRSRSLVHAQPPQPSKLPTRGPSRASIARSWNSRSPG